MLTLGFRSMQRSRMRKAQPEDAQNYASGTASREADGSETLNMSERDLNDDVVLVAGSTGVLGGLIAKELGARGARLILGGRNQQRLDALAERLPGSVSSELDFLKPETIATTLELGLSTFGRLGGVVNAAGSVAFGPLAETDRALLDELLAVDLIGPLDLIGRALPHLEGGFIVNITGVVAEQGFANMVAYSAAKAGLSHASLALKRELRRQKVTVLDARPPHTETGLATRPLGGVAPQMPEGLDPAAVASAIVTGVVAGQTELSSDSFTK